LEKEKIGIVEILKVKTHGRRLYVVIPSDVVTTFEIKKGDMLRVKLEELIRTESGEEYE